MGHKVRQSLAARCLTLRQRLVKPGRLHFARTARALTGRYMCERGDLSEFLAARTCASCWFDKTTPLSARQNAQTRGPHCARQARQRLASRARRARRALVRVNQSKQASRSDTRSAHGSKFTFLSHINGKRILPLCDSSLSAVGQTASRKDGYHPSSSKQLVGCRLSYLFTTIVRKAKRRE